jgi:hypothetical protein
MLEQYVANFLTLFDTKLYIINVHSFYLPTCFLLALVTIVSITIPHVRETEGAVWSYFAVHHLLVC